MALYDATVLELNFFINLQMRLLVNFSHILEKKLGLSNPSDTNSKARWSDNDLIITSGRFQILSKLGVNPTIFRLQLTIKVPALS